MNFKNFFNELPENEKISLIEKVMPMSGTYRQLDESGWWSSKQWEILEHTFINSIQWDKRDLMETISIHDKSYLIFGESELGNKYNGIGNYSCGELVDIEELTLNK